MDIQSFGKPIYQTIEGKDFIFMNSALPSEYNSGKKDFVGLKFFLLEKNPYLFGMTDNEVCELHLGPKKLRMLFDLLVKMPNPLLAPVNLVFKKGEVVYKDIAIEDLKIKEMIIKEIQYLNEKWKD